MEKQKNHHPCPICTKCFLKASSLKAHQRTAHSQKELETKSHLDLHQQRMHCHQLSQDCQVCLPTFSNEGNLKEYCSQEMVQAVNNHKCPKCDECFPDQSVLSSHVTDCHGAEDPRCPKCDKAFTKQSSLKVHLKNAHDNKKAHECATCWKRFAEADLLKRHALLHDRGSSHWCDACDIGFSRKAYLDRHRQSVHSEQTTGSCSQSVKQLLKQNLCPTELQEAVESEGSHLYQKCEKGFLTKAQLKSNVTIVHKWEKPSCPQCSKTFSKTSNLKAHLTNVHGKAGAHKCLQCDKSFTEAGSLKRHLLQHTGEKPYRCETCQKTFRQAVHLDRHSQSHQSYRPHNCHLCFKDFADRQTLREHFRRKHGDSKPFQCDTCHRCFSSHRELTAHELVHKL